MPLVKTVFIYLVIIFLLMPYRQLSAQDEERGFMAGLDAGITYTADIFSNTHGGLERGFRYMDNLDLEVSFDTDEGLGWGSTEFFIYGLANQGGSISELTGDIQGVSNIESETSWRIYEAWFQKYIYGIRTSILAGLYDLNSEFDVINTATLFINSSHGIGAEYGLSGVQGPSIFPYTSLGVRLKSNPLGGIVLKGAILDGIPSNPENTDGTKIFLRKRDGLLLAGEAALYPHGDKAIISRQRAPRIRQFLSRNVGAGNKFKVAVGGWIYTRQREGWLGNEHRNQGLYALGEYQLFREGSDQYQGLSGFVRYGLANGKINRLNTYAGGGLVYTGLIVGRPEDQLGLAVAVPFSSDDYRELTDQPGVNPATYEMNIEVTYQFQVRNFSFVQLDLQYIVQPGLLEDRADAVVVGTRIQLSL